jgi:hypothetical protein
MFERADRVVLSFRDRRRWRVVVERIGARKADCAVEAGAARQAKGAGFRLRDEELPAIGGVCRWERRIRLRRVG